MSCANRGLGGHGQGCCKGSNEIRGVKHYKPSSAGARARTAITTRPRVLPLVPCPRPAGQGPRPPRPRVGALLGTCLPGTTGPRRRPCCLLSLSSKEAGALWRTRVRGGEANPVPGGETGCGQVVAQNYYEGQSLWGEVGWVRAEPPLGGRGACGWAALWGLGRFVSLTSGP